MKIYKTSKEQGIKIDINILNYIEIYDHVVLNFQIFNEYKKESNIKTNYVLRFTDIKHKKEKQNKHIMLITLKIRNNRTNIIYSSIIEISHMQWDDHSMSLRIDIVWNN